MGEALYLLNCLICYRSSVITMLMGLCEFCEFFYALFLYFFFMLLFFTLLQAQFYGLYGLPLAAKQEKFVYLEKLP